MSVAARKLATAPDAVDVFTALCEAEALIWHTGGTDLRESVDALQNHAEAFGLVTEFGQDFVQAIMARAFRAYAGRQL